MIRMLLFFYQTSIVRYEGKSKGIFSSVPSQYAGGISVQVGGLPEKFIMRDDSFPRKISANSARYSEAHRGKNNHIPWLQFAVGK
jgi:hypothetical protein